MKRLVFLVSTFIVISSKSKVSYKLKKKDGSEPKEEGTEQEIPPLHITKYTNRIPDHPTDQFTVKIGQGAQDMATELHEAAYKVAKYYISIFKYADKNCDDVVSAQELGDIITNHNWPKYHEKTQDQMSKQIIDEFGDQATQSLDFGQFKTFLENLWVIKANIKVQACTARINNYLNSFKMVYDFLDIEKKQEISKKAIQDGLNVLLSSKIPDLNIDPLVDQFAKNQLFTYEQFVIMLTQNKLFTNMQISYKNLSEKK